MPDATKVLKYFRLQTPEMLSLLSELVKRESPSLDKTAVDRASDLLETELAVLPVEVERLTQKDYGDFLRVRRAADGKPVGRPILLLTHMDTVWPVGTLSKRPFKVDGDIVTGPGCLDDKSGQVILLSVLRAVRDLDIELARPLRAILNSEEELGSPAARALIENEASESDFVLCLEPPGPGGALLTSRKAVARFKMTITGRASHSGSDPEKGRSAIDELACQVTELHALSDPSVGINVNVGVVAGGERANVIAPSATAAIDLRAPTIKSGQAIAQRILSASPHREGIHVEVTGGFTRPAMERTEGVVKLFELARTLGGQLGLDLAEVAAGGGSDASFASALGVATLDGLGAIGDGKHADDEYLLVSSLAERAALVTLLVEHLANKGL